MKESLVKYHRVENCGIITFNRPHRLNAITVDLLKAFMERMEAAGQDQDVAVVILTGDGRAFCAGEDLKETASGKSLSVWMEETERLQEIQRIIMKLGKPLIAAVNGYALGGGMRVCHEL
jgi:enoyl-CoA hydratase/carnithine racemase